MATTKVKAKSEVNSRAEGFPLNGIALILNHNPESDVSLVRGLQIE